MLPSARPLAASQKNRAASRGSPASPGIVTAVSRETLPACLPSVVFGQPQDEQVERRVGAEDRRLGGVVAGDVARVERRRPVLLGPVQPAPQQQRQVQALGVAGGDVLGRPPHRVRARRRSGRRRSTRGGRPTSAPRTGRSSRSRCAAGGRRRRTTSPRSRLGRVPPPRWCRSATSSCAGTAPWLVLQPVSPSTVWSAGRHSTTACGPFP